MSRTHRGLRSLLCTLSLLVVAAGSTMTASPAHAAPPTKKPPSTPKVSTQLTKEPHDAQLVSVSVSPSIRASRRPVTVAVTTRRPVDRVQARLNGVRSSRVRVTKVSATRWQVRVAPAALRAGMNHVDVDAWAGKTNGFAVAQFDYLRPARGLVRHESGPPRQVRSSLPIGLSVKPGATVQAWLNGKSLAAETVPANRSRGRDGRERLRFDVGAAHGLKFGANQLVVQASQNGRYTRLSSTVRVDRRQTLAAAGPSKTLRPNQGVTLDARASRSARGGTLSYAWSVVSGPSGSRAKPSNLRAATAQFRPDRPGVYRLKATITETVGGRKVSAGSENVTFSASNKAMVQVQTNVVSNGASGITLDGQFTSGPSQGVVPDPIQVFVLDRHTLAPPPPNQIAGFATNNTEGIVPFIQGTGVVTPIVILQFTALTSQGNDFEGLTAALNSIGGVGFGGDADEAFSFTAIGVSGTPVGSATQSCMGTADWPNTDPRCNVGGFFSSPLDGGAYTFSPGDNPRFNTRAGGDPTALTNTMTFGATFARDTQSIVAPPLPAGSSGGYHVVTLERRGLNVVTNDSFATGNPSTAATDMPKMLEVLQGAVSARQLVMMTSLGTAATTASTGDGATWSKILQTVSLLGGTPDVLAQTITQQPPTNSVNSYSLVGAAGDVDYGRVAEVSSVIPPPTGGQPFAGTAIGVLERSKIYEFQPREASNLTVDPKGDFYAAIYRDSVAWPGTTATDYDAAAAHIAAAVLGAASGYTDVRDAYSQANAVADGWTAQISTVRGLTTDGCRCSAGTLESLKVILTGDPDAGTEGEFQQVDRAVKFLTFTIQEPYKNSKLPNYASLQTLADDISNAILPQQQTDVTVNIFSLIGGMFTPFGALDGVGPAFNAFAGAMGMASAFSSDDSGASIEETVRTTAAHLGVDITNRVDSVLTGYNAMAAVAVTDAGRLAAVSDAVQQTKWSVGGTEIEAVMSTIAKEARAEFATALVLAGRRTLLSSVSYNGTPYDSSKIYPFFFTDPGHIANSRTREQLTDVTKLLACNRTLVYAPHFPPSTQYAHTIGFTNGKPLVSVFFLMNVAGNYNHGGSTGFPSSLTPLGCSVYPPDHFSQVPAIWDALFAEAGSSPATSSGIAGVGLYKPWFWWRNSNQAACWGWNNGQCSTFPTSLSSPLPDVESGDWDPLADGPSWFKGTKGYQTAAVWAR